MCSEGLLHKYLEKKKATTPLLKGIQLGKTEFPFYLYISFLLRQRTNLSFSSSTEEELILFCSWWYTYEARNFENAWQARRIGGMLEPVLYSLLFKPVLDSVKLDGVHFCLHHQIQAKNIDSSLFKNSLETVEGKKEYLRWYYRYSVASAENQISGQELEWLRKTVLLESDDRNDVEIPWGLKIFTEPTNCLYDNFHLLIATVDYKSGFPSIWLKEYEDFFSHNREGELFEKYLATLYSCSEKVRQRVSEITELVEKNPLLGDWAEFLLRSLGENTETLRKKRATPGEYRAAVPVKEGVSFLGFPKATFGIGEVTRSCCSAFKDAQVEVEMVGLEAGFPSSRAGGSFSCREITLLNAPIHYPGVLVTQGISWSSFVDTYFIGYAPWELARWGEQFRFWYRFYDEIWAPTRFIQTAFSEGSLLPVVYMPYPVLLAAFEKKSRVELQLPEVAFLFFTSFDFNSFIERKNPLAVVRAFKNAFPEGDDVGLVIKVMYANEEDAKWQEFLREAQTDSRIRILNQILSREELLSLMDSMDAFISLHRAEGFGLGLAEAMLLNKPVIATQYSGNVDFCGEEWSFPVEFKLKKIKAGEYPFAEGLEWADPVMESAVSQMRKVRAAGSSVASVVLAGRRNIETHYSARACGERFRQRLQMLR